MSPEENQLNLRGGVVREEEEDWRVASESGEKLEKYDFMEAKHVK